MSEKRELPPGSSGSPGSGDGWQDEEPTDLASLHVAFKRVRKDLADMEERLAHERAQHERALAEVAGKSPGKYFFTLKSKLRPVSNKEATVGFEVPEGIRLHVNYLPEQDQKAYEVTTNLAHPTLAGAADDWTSVDGKILSGGDWVLIQKNGVAKFDARVTIKTDDDVLIDGVFSGEVDLAAAVPKAAAAAKDRGRAVYQAYLDGKPEVKDLPVTLAVRFEAAGEPYTRPGEDKSWIDKSRYARQRKNFPNYQRLVRGLFVARGHVTLGDDKRWPPTEIDLRIFDLV